MTMTHEEMAFRAMKSLGYDGRMMQSLLAFQEALAAFDLDEIEEADAVKDETLVIAALAIYSVDDVEIFGASDNAAENFANISAVVESGSYDEPWKDWIEAGKPHADTVAEVIEVMLEDHAAAQE